MAEVPGSAVVVVGQRRNFWARHRPASESRGFILSKHHIACWLQLLLMPKGDFVEEEILHKSHLLVAATRMEGFFCIF